MKFLRSHHFLMISKPWKNPEICNDIRFTTLILISSGELYPKNLVVFRLLKIVNSINQNKRKKKHPSLRCGHFSICSIMNYSPLVPEMEIKCLWQYLSTYLYILKEMDYFCYCFDLEKYKGTYFVS